MKLKSSLGAPTDDPLALADRAIMEAESALKQRDTVGFRQAAEIGWLSASATADVVADRMGMPIPGGASGRRVTLENLEDAARLRRGSLVGRFEAARTVLHGECFHNDTCSERGVLGTLDEVRTLATDATRALGRIRIRKRRSRS